MPVDRYGSLYMPPTQCHLVKWWYGSTSASPSNCSVRKLQIPVNSWLLTRLDKWWRVFQALQECSQHVNCNGYPLHFRPCYAPVQANKGSTHQQWVSYRLQTWDLIYSANCVQYFLECRQRVSHLTQVLNTECKLHHSDSKHIYFFVKLGSSLPSLTSIVLFRKRAFWTAANTVAGSNWGRRYNSGSHSLAKSVQTPPHIVFGTRSHHR